MSSQFFGLNIGASALSAYQASINTTANNIANVQTNGYSRQVTRLEATSPLRVYAKYGSTGTGVAATEIRQERDLYYDTKYWENHSSLGYYEEKLYYTGQVENVFTDDSVQEGFTTIFSKMFNGLDSLHGGNAHDKSVRNQFIHQAQSLCTYFNSLSDSLKEVQKDTNEEILSATENINSIAKKISLLNKEINRIEVNSGYANELRDERALLLDELSAIVNVETREYEVKNSYGENLGGTNFLVLVNGQVLVDGNEYRTLECTSSEYSNNQTDAEGLYEISWTDTGSEFAATTGTAGGSLKALFDLRDGNNNDGFKATVDSFPKDADGNIKSIKLSNIVNTDINSLNIPKEGTIHIANTPFVYTGWEAELDGDGNIVNVTFQLKEAADPMVIQGMEGQNVEIGKNVDAMGIPYYQQQINEFLRNFVEMFNDIEKKGQTVDGQPMGAFFTGQNDTGTEFDFAEWGVEGQRATKISSTSDSYYQLTAFNVAVNKKSLKDPGYFSTTVNVANGSDAVDLVDELAKLQKDVEMFRGDNASAFLETLLSDIAVDTEKTTIYFKNYTNMEQVIGNQRMSVFGVDEDEEALNLVKFQNAYNLSSKVVSVLNEVYDKLINQTGVT